MKSNKQIQITISLLRKTCVYDLPVFIRGYFLSLLMTLQLHSVLRAIAHISSRSINGVSDSKGKRYLISRQMYTSNLIFSDNTAKTGEYSVFLSFMKKYIPEMSIYQIIFIYGYSFNCSALTDRMIIFLRLVQYSTRTWKPCIPITG